MNAEFGIPIADDDPALIAAGKRRLSRRAVRIRLHASLVALDVIAIFASLLFASFVYPVGVGEAITIALALIPIYVLSAFGSRSYSTEAIASAPLGVTRSLQSLVVATAAVIFIAFYLKASADISRVIFAIGFIGSAITLASGRYFFAKHARSMLGESPFMIVLISDGTVSVSPEEYSAILPASSFDPEAHDPQMYDRLARALRTADRVVVGCAPEHRLAWAHALKGSNVQAEILAPELHSIKPMTVARFAGTPTLVVSRGPLNLPSRILKRAFDIGVAGVSLVLILPVILISALLIKLESRGPVFFVQIRIGRANELFRMYKFRSMRTDLTDHSGDTLTARGVDPRVTRVGKWLRKTSIDELPQLINVLKGEMSIVGPRPHALGARAADKLYWEVDGRYWHRHAAKPGLTGLAQVRGYRGNTEEEHDLTNRLQSDLEYLERWSLWKDMMIIAMTFRVLLHKNAF
ncbi:exopolysaccharide biosynthesis polyprenyl glycosylphosphotransferase [Sphingomonas sp. G-3-2-10]|uniref:exopolysaccharide biosynthesis polyprenyl glycosylphosphotransferase n=1 Tax=Sphingomonas sp. G-3-2-10 TaxID=2728838 RepID=UPI00146C50FD|nr:exopolysaccharide biosynthesis polyprenyl glycosylphosphotransferase [Sphingomonas sp. G-3-2-10]NML04447.1 exopolysaccharide biosynthesis polyprenyl glycosylphosphotransferase [Sphingomonas sp. G-3-2-10]